VTVLKAILGMFVDDGMLALMCIVLTAALAAAVLLLHLPALAAGLALLAGCIAILARSVLRAAAARPSRPGR
jgi:hypothetical protein